jgi:multidrug transporter EmrE-like cation transporter
VADSEGEVPPAEVVVHSKVVMILTLLASVTVSALGQTSLKAGLDRIPNAESTSAARLLPAAALQPLVWLGIGLFVASVLLWMVVLARTQLSWAYPILGLSYVFVALSGWLVFGEELTPMRLAGIALVITGAALVGAS